MVQSISCPQCNGKIEIKLEDILNKSAWVCSKCNLKLKLDEENKQVEEIMKKFNDLKG